MKEEGGRGGGGGGGGGGARDMNQHTSHASRLLLRSFALVVVSGARADRRRIGSEALVVALVRARRGQWRARGSEEDRIGGGVVQKRRLKKLDRRRGAIRKSWIVGVFSGSS